MSFSVINQKFDFCMGVQNFPCWQLGPKGAPPKHNKNRCFSKLFFEKTYASRNGHFWTKKYQNPEIRNLGTTPILKKTLSEWKGHSRSNSRNSGVFSEQLSEWYSRPNLCENPYSRSNSRSNSRNWLDTKISAQILGAFFSKLGWSPRSRRNYSCFCASPPPPNEQMATMCKTV